MQGNFNFERIARKSNIQRPPRGEQSDQGSQHQPQAKRGKQWERAHDKREQAQFFNAFQ